MKNEGVLQLHEALTNSFEEKVGSILSVSEEQFSVHSEAIKGDNCWS